MRPILLALLASVAFAQAPPAPKPIKLGSLTVSGTLRIRPEFWDWFQPTGNFENEYNYVGDLLRVSIGQQKDAYDWQLEMALPFLLNLPDRAIAPGAQGQLGLGASYFAANGQSANAAMLFPKQAFVRVKHLGGHPAHSMRFGRIEYVEGTEVTPKDATLALIKRERIAHRLLGNFGFTHVMRSFDGLQYTVDTPKANFTFFGARPTRGVFQTDGWGEIDAAIFYGALTAPVKTHKGAGEWRFLVLQTNDWRSALKTDNRPLADRRADTANLAITTIGGNYIHAQQTPAGTLDFLFWGVLQTGSWGVQDHRAGAVSIEGGIQPRGIPRLRPWLRAGFHHGSGDSNPADGKHGTFYQAFPTARWYARFPFYNLMNIEDLFGDLMVRPHPRLTLRTQVRSLRLAQRNDLWYVGGGAFQPWSFGFQGRPSNGARGLATLYDGSVDWVVNPNLTLGAYIGKALGRGVPASIYPAGKDARLGFLELTTRF